jgi:hypothetical protein
VVHRWEARDLTRQVGSTGCNPVTGRTVPATSTYFADMHLEADPCNCAILAKSVNGRNLDFLMPLQRGWRVSLYVFNMAVFGRYLSVFEICGYTVVLPSL